MIEDTSLLFQVMLMKFLLINVKIFSCLNMVLESKVLKSNVDFINLPSILIKYFTYYASYIKNEVWAHMWVSVKNLKLIIKWLNFIHCSLHLFSCWWGLDGKRVSESHLCFQQTKKKKQNPSLVWWQICEYFNQFNSKLHLLWHKMISRKWFSYFTVFTTT